METIGTGKIASVVVSDQARALTKTSNERCSLLEKLLLNLIAMHCMIDDHRPGLEEELWLFMEAMRKRLC
jgi:hypothetical protein